MLKKINITKDIILFGFIGLAIWGSGGFGFLCWFR